MLQAELAGLAYNKSAHRRALRDKIGRVEASIEFKHQNISAVLLGLGHPWIEGYKPASNFQASLVDAVVQYLHQTPNWLTASLTASGASSKVKEDGPLWIGPPPTHSNCPPAIDQKKVYALAAKFDVAERDARNRLLGRAGEERVLDHERVTLIGAGRHDLAKLVRWVSVEEGDGAGFDISSFETDGTPRLVEVKTTNGWERTPFHLTRNELAVADDNRDTWHLVRLWNFTREPKAYAIRPPLERHVELTPTSFLAAPH